MEKLLCPSMMCADYSRLEDSVRELEEAGIDIFHCDIMDGSYVPNITMGIMDVMAIKKHADKPVDCHLMINNPADKVDWFLDAGADIIYIHPEADMFPSKTLQHIRQRGAKAGIAINPDTSIERVREIIHECDYFMVMTVYPGFAGQKYLDFVTDKVARLARLKEKYGFKIMIDGACSAEVISNLSGLGADGFVLGTSALFNKGRSYKELIQELRSL